jgi:hypothetical protein
MSVLAEIAYESAVRALDKQERVLEEIRVRMTILLTASSIAVSLLGRSALEEPHPVAVVVAALCAFAASIGASVIVLLPRPGFVFAIDGPAVFEGLHQFRDQPPEVHRRLAYALNHLRDMNDRRLGPLITAVRIAAVALVVEIVALTLAVTSTL